MDSETYAPDFNISCVYLFWEQVNFDLNLKNALRKKKSNIIDFYKMLGYFYTIKKMTKSCQFHQEDSGKGRKFRESN